MQKAALVFNNNVMISDIVGLPAKRVGDDNVLGICTDALIDIATKKIVYLLLDAHGDGGAPVGVVSTSVAKIHNDSIAVELTDSLASEWQAALDGNNTAEVVDPTVMPSLLTGPFGYSIAPSMIAAIINRTAGERPSDDRPGFDQRHEHWHWATHLLNLPVFDAAGELGDLQGIEVASSDFGCSGLRVTNLEGGSTDFNFARLSHVSKGQTSIVLQGAS